MQCRTFGRPGWQVPDIGFGPWRRSNGYAGN